MHDTQIVVLAAGKGKRMGDQELPKVLVPLHGKPIISYLLTELKKLPLAQAPVIVVGYQQEKVREALGDGYMYAVQKDMLGTAHAVAAAQSAITASRIMVLNGDMPFMKSKSLMRLQELHSKSDAPLALVTSTVPSFEGVFKSLKDYGRILRTENGQLLQIKEVKDANEQQKTIREVNPGIYTFKTAWLWDNIGEIKNNNSQNEFYLTDILEIALSQGYSIPTLEFEPEEILGINTPEQLEAAELVAENL